ncbi:WD40 repeat-like protein [Ganoderma leucocontextum]|nr:WD40 repeat-like protein [Ganoderma leucocontextum]
MSSFPCKHLVFGSDKVLVVSGHQYSILDFQDGDLTRSTTQLEVDLQESLSKSGPIRCVAVNIPFTHVATTGDDKKLKIWKVADNLELLNERELPKKPTEVSFTRDGQTIIVSDKFGDIFSYPLHPEPISESSNPTSGASKRGSLTAHENPSNGTLVLGHASLLTTFLLTSDEQYIITADRDEHIRVSWYPQGYNIERYCLGHEKFVSALHIPSFHEATLVSGGGDPVLKVWDWMSGQLLADIPVFDVAEPYIKVKAPKRKRGWSDEDGEGEGAEGGEAQNGKGKGKGRGRRARGKGKGKGKESAEAEKDEDGSGAPEEEQGDKPMAEAEARSPVDENARANLTSEDTVLVFVVHKIRSVDRGEHGRFIIFNVVGASALFYTPFPEESASPSSAVLAVEFPVPVIDFSVASDGAVWTLLDAEWAGAHPSSSESPRFARLLSWEGSTLSESATENPLLTALNSKCPVPATPAELKTLDLYSDLSSLPKHVDPEHDALIRDTLSEAAAFDPQTEGKQLTQRELGRLKKKKALLAKIQEREELSKRASREGSVEGGRGIKKSRSDSADGEEVLGSEEAEKQDVQDVEMDAS